MAFKKYSKLLFSSTAMGVRIPPRVHPVSHPGPKWSTAFSSTAMGVRIPPRSPWTKMEHRNLWRNSSWLIHWLLSRDSNAVAFGPSTFSQHHLGPLPELLGFEKWSKQRCTETKVRRISPVHHVSFSGLWYFPNVGRLRLPTLLLCFMTSRPS